MPNAQGGGALDPGAQAAELWSRIAVTLAALIVYRAGCHLPIPGLNGTAVASLFSGGDAKLAIERISIFALGILPLLSALLLAEFGKIIFPSFGVWAEANGARFNRFARLAALGLAALQGMGIALGLEDVASFVEEPGLAFRAGTTLTLIAGTAFIIWLADLVTRYGVGSGLWLLLAAPGLAELPSMTAGLLYLAETGSISPIAAALTVATVVLSTAAFIALAKANGGTEFPSGSVGPWPVLLGYASLGWIVGALLVVPSQTWREGVLVAAGQGQPVNIILHALLVGLFVLLYANRARTSGRGEIGFGLVAALTLMAIALVPELLASYFRMPVIADGRWLVIIVTVALCILAALPGEKTGAQGAQKPL
jgi:preprotein translocase subunit SecY